LKTVSDQAKAEAALKAKIAACRKLKLRKACQEQKKKLAELRAKREQCAKKKAMSNSPNFLNQNTNILDNNYDLKKKLNQIFKHIK